MNRQTKIFGAVALLAISGYIWYKSKQGNKSKPSGTKTGAKIGTGTASGSGNSGSGSALLPITPAPKSVPKLVTQTRPIPASMGKAGALNQKDNGQGLTTPAQNPKNNTNNPAQNTNSGYNPNTGYNPQTYGGGYSPTIFGNQYGNNPSYGYDNGWAGGGTSYGGFHYGNGGLISG